MVNLLIKLACIVGEFNLMGAFHFEVYWSYRIESMVWINLCQLFSLILLTYSPF